MPDVSVDNTPVGLVLDPNETFTPATGTTIVANIQVSENGAVSIEDLIVTADNIAAGSTNNVESEISVVLTDDSTVIENGGEQVFISGFEV